MAQISAQADVAVGQIYRDFSGKEAIVSAIVANDLAELLDEKALANAIDRKDEGAVRGWIARFVRRHGDLIEQCLLPEILAEAMRNQQIADLLRCADESIRRELDAAFLMLAPEPGKAEGRAELVELVLTLSIGLPHRLITLPKANGVALADCLIALIDREIDRLQAA